MKPKSGAESATYHIKDGLRSDRKNKSHQGASDKRASHHERVGEQVETVLT